MPRRTALLLCALLAATMTSCVSRSSVPEAKQAVPSTPPPLSVIRATQYTETFDLFVDGHHVGYVTEFLPAPMGVQDSRVLPVGSLKVEDLSFRWHGYIGPNGSASRFDDRDRIVPVLAKGRNEQILAIRGIEGTSVSLVPLNIRP